MEGEGSCRSNKHACDTNKKGMQDQKWQNVLVIHQASACCTADNVGMTFNEPKINCVDHDSNDALKDSLIKRQRLLEMLAYRPIIPIVSDGCTCQRVKPKQWRA